MHHQEHDMNNWMKTRYTTSVDPFVINRLHAVTGKVLLVQTTRDTLRGKLVEVQPDHIVLSIGDATFFIRIQQIVSIMPD